jgi:hypothetical protein
MSTQDRKKSVTKCDIENFKIISEHFRQDLREFWNRANFYLVTNTGLFSAFLIVYPSLSRDHLAIVFIVPILGIAIASLWLIVLRGALFWIKQWREQIKNLSKQLDRFECYYNVESMLEEHKYKSPSYLTQFVPVAFIGAWVSILLILLCEVL